MSGNFCLRARWVRAKGTKTGVFKYGWLKKTWTLASSKPTDYTQTSFIPPFHSVILTRTRCSLREKTLLHDSEWGVRRSRVSAPWPAPAPRGRARADGTGGFGAPAERGASRGHTHVLSTRLVAGNKAAFPFKATVSSVSFTKSTKAIVFRWG